MRVNQGVFVVSIDFELYWGLRDVMTAGRYRRELLPERELIPSVLNLFREQGIHATWATVGLLFLREKRELWRCLPPRLPGYRNSRLSPYPALFGEAVGQNEEQDPLHYAPSLIRLIRETPYQRIGTHTFSHYYCREQGQTAAEFAADLEAAVRAAEREGISLESIVFPRNQLRDDYLQELPRLGIRSYRGNPEHPLYRGGYSKNDPFLKRLLRLLDAYINLTGCHTYPAPASVTDGNESGSGAPVPVNLPASHFLRSYVKPLGCLEPLRLRRITSAMTRAAKRGEVYHLWWHPYNLADREGRSFRLLERIVAHFKELEEQYGMRSAGMEELYEWITKREGESG